MKLTINSILDFKLSPYSERFMLSSGLTPTRAISPLHTCPWPPFGSLSSTTCSVPPPCHPPSYCLKLFSSQNFSRIHTPTFLKPSHSTPTCLWRWNRPECSETSAYKIQTPGNYPEENIQQLIASLTRQCWSWSTVRPSNSSYTIGLGAPYYRKWI